MRFGQRFLACLCAVSLALPAVVLAQDSEPPKDDAEETEKRPLDFSGSSFLKLLEGLQTPTSEAQDFDTSKPVVGFGISRVPNGMKIDIVLEGSAAESAGLAKDMVILRINGISIDQFTNEEAVKILGAIDGEIIFDVEGRGRFSLIKAPIPPQGDGA